MVNVAVDVMQKESISFDKFTTCVIWWCCRFF